MVWNDVTEQFKASISQLSLGQMVSSDLFKLDDAMSAIELMEPRMDPGYDLKNKELKFNQTRESLLSHSFSEHGQIRIVDMLMGLVYNWLIGNLYIQTVHSTIFMIDRAKLRDPALRFACNEVFGLCCDLRKTIMATGVCDEEDFIGFMFGLDGDDLKANICSPQVSEATPGMKLRFEFISLLGEIVREPTSLDLPDMLSRMDSLIDQVCAESLDESAFEADLISASIDPCIHRNLMPPGPPRRVAPVKTTKEIYSDWKTVFDSIGKGLNILTKDLFSESIFSIFNALGRVRRIPNFRFSFTRAVLYHRTYYGVDIAEKISLLKCSDKEFRTDLCSVLHKVLFTLFRSASRQHRRLKHVLADLSVMQHRAWALCGTDKSLWSFVALIGSYLIELNLVLTFELNLNDDSPRLVYFLLENVTGVRLFLANDLATSLPAMDLRAEIISAAVEHYLVKAMGQLLCEATPLNETERLFELRSMPLRAFPLPTVITFEDFGKWYQNNKTNSSNHLKAAEDCLAWIARANDSIDGPVIGNDLNGIKRTLVSNKIFLVKNNQPNKWNNKYHPIAITLVS